MTSRADHLIVPLSIGASYNHGFPIHDMRHTFASQLVMAGIDMVTVQKLLGHKKIDIDPAISTPRRHTSTNCNQGA